MLKISILSTVFVKSRITATKNGLTYNPTADTAEIAFVGPGVTPAPGDWHAGTWETAGTGVYYARLLVGPVGGLVLATGAYTMWIRITDNPEVPALEAGGLRVY
jgi:hypothetical protein